MAQVVPDSTTSLSLAARIALAAAARSAHRAHRRLNRYDGWERTSALNTRAAFKDATKMLREAMVGGGL